MLRDLKEIEIKQERILDFMVQNSYDAVVIGRQDNFSWLTCGGHNCVLHTSEFGVAFAVMTKDRKFLVANSMDGRRIIEEEMQNMGFELVELRWYDKSTAETVVKLLEGRKVLSDIALPGADHKPGLFYDMQYPLTEGEIQRYRWLGRKAEEIVYKIAGEIKPGMSELEVQALLLCEYAKLNITAPVIIIGSDERIAAYRHCTPTEKKIGSMVMLAPAVQKWGLTVPMTRFVCFHDKLSLETAKKYQAACIIEANTMAACTPGKKFSEILSRQKELYHETGYPEEWKEHFLGGITGYVINDPTRCNDPQAAVQEKQTFNWYITITGVKVEETFLAGSSDKQILTSTGLWPVKRYEAGAEVFELPQVMFR